MELQIFNCMIYGALNPRFETSPQGAPVPYGELYNELNREYRDISDMEETFATILDDYIKWDFSDGEAFFLGPDDLSGRIHHYPVSVTFDTGTETPLTEKESFYQILLKLETSRIRRSIDRYAKTVLNAFDIKMEVIDTIGKIERTAEKIRTKSDRIFKWMRESLLKLYSEIYSLYYSLISDEGLVTHRDLFFKLFGKYPAAEDEIRFGETCLTARLQELILSGETADSGFEKEIETISRINPESELAKLCLWFEAVYLAGRYGFVTDDLEKAVSRRALLRGIRTRLRQKLSGGTTRDDKSRFIESELESIPESTLHGSPITEVREFLLDEQRGIESEEETRPENPYKKRDGLRLVYQCTSDSLRDCLDTLTKSGLVDLRTAFIDFRKSFTGLVPGTKINWTGTIPELTAFIKEIKNRRLLEDSRYYWEKVAEVFVHNGRTVTAPQLRTQHISLRDKMTTKNAVQMLTQ